MTPSRWGQRRFFLPAALAVLLITIVGTGLAGCRSLAVGAMPFDARRDLTEALPVFPGAEGFGTTTPAGRGGRILVVSNLNAHGPGSLAAAIAESGPRTIVFEVGGTIELEHNLVVREPFLTVAGQTAPEPGITLLGAGFVVNTHDVLVQHLRARPGDRPNGADPESRDGISVVGDRRGETAVYNVVIDHCSVSWAVDEGMSTWYAGVHDVTFSHNFIAENLSQSIHPKGEHSKGLLVGDHSRRIALIGNIFAHNMRRNPLVKGDTSTLIVNNVIYNGGGQGIGFSDRERSGPSAATIIGNLFIPGVDTRGDEYLWRGPHTSNETAIYLEGNAVDTGTLVPYRPSRSIRDVVVSAPPVAVTPLTVLSAVDLEGTLVLSAGARPAQRDPTDRRILQDLAARTGRIIDSQEEVGGYPTPTPTYRALFLPDDPSGDDDGDGYTNLEAWLFERSNEVTANDRL
jgi:hypothetical protein